MLRSYLLVVCIEHLIQILLEPSALYTYNHINVRFRVSLIERLTITICIAIDGILVIEGIGLRLTTVPCQHAVALILDVSRINKRL